MDMRTILMEIMKKFLNFSVLSQVIPAKSRFLGWCRRSVMEDLYAIVLKLLELLLTVLISKIYLRYLN